MLYIRQTAGSTNTVNLHKVNYMRKYEDSNGILPIFKLFFHFDKDCDSFSFKTEEDLNLAIKKIDSILNTHSTGLFILNEVIIK